MHALTDTTTGLLGTATGAVGATVEGAERAAEAETRIRGMRDQAMGNVRTVAAETAEAMVEKLTGRAAHRAEIDTALGAA